MRCSRVLMKSGGTGHVMRICAPIALVAVLVAAAALAPAAFGADRVYWGNSGGIAFAKLDGSGGDDLDVTGVSPSRPWGLAFDPVTGRVYWANDGNNEIQYANADGSGGAGQLSTGSAHVNYPSGVAIDPATRRIYWGNQGTNDISYVDLDHSANSGQLNIAGSNPGQPTGLAIDPDNRRLYWTNLLTNTISYAKLDGSGGGDLTITGTTVTGGPSGIAIDLSAGRLYWANRFKNSTGAIGFANLDGSNGGDLNTAGATMNVPDGVAIDVAFGKLYWANRDANTISYAKLDGSGGGDLGTAGATTNGPYFPILIETPKSTDVPTISGGADPGSTLTCSSVTWGSDMPWAFLWRAPLSFGYQWTLDGNDIAGARQSSYTALQAGSYTCRDIAANEVGTSSVTSAPHTVQARTSNTTTTTTTTTTPSPDVTPPVLTLLKLTPTVFRAVGSGPSIARAKIGTRVSYTLSEASTTTFKGERAVPGVKSGHSCVKPSARTRRGKRCTRFVAVSGDFTHSDSTGANNFRFTGRIGGRALKAGNYRLDATPKDAAGNVGPTMRSQFHIVR